MKDRGNRRRKKQEDTSSTATSSSSSSSEDDVRITSKRHKHSRKRHREDRSRSDGISRRDEEKRRRRRNKKRERNRSKDENRKSRREGKRKASESESEDGSASETDNDSYSMDRPEGILQHILKEFPSVMGDLVKLLQMIDDGQGVDISGLSEILLVENLKKLFYSLHLKEKDNKFLLRRKARPTLEVVLPIIQSWTQSEKNLSDKSLSPKDTHRVTSGVDAEQKLGNNTAMPCQEEDVGPRKRVIGPAMPSAELLAAAAKLNEAERFEEVTRIMSVEVDNPYDVVGVNRNMLDNNIKKRYWKLSLMVHPDKCSHPEANQAFIKLNKAFKDLQDPNKRKALDDKIKLKEEQEEFKAELKTMREAAQWRRLQGISMEGDDALLADMDVKVEPRREEWMTTLPPERKPGVTMQTTKFSKNAKEGRGDTSIWTDTPSERAQKAKMNYLEAYNEAAALASNELEKKMNPDAELVDKYNKAKRSKSLVEKHQEAVSGRTSSKKKSKSKQQQDTAKGEWEGQHPWKPWDREKDLTAGRQSVKLDPENMSQGLTSRFSSGSFQRNFL